MLNKTLYPKTKRVKLENKVVITEKLDGSNNHAIYVKEAYGHPIKKWDLCERCYKSLERGVNKK